MPGTDGAWSTTRFVDIADLRHDMHVNIVNFQPGGTIPFPETHVMEHGLYVLEGKAVYLLNEDWVEVEAGDFMWLRAFCPQACYAGGPGPFRYLLYKDVNRHVGLTTSLSGPRERRPCGGCRLLRACGSQALLRSLRGYAAGRRRPRPAAADARAPLAAHRESEPGRRWSLPPPYHRAMEVRAQPRAAERSNRLSMEASRRSVALAWEPRRRASDESGSTGGARWLASWSTASRGRWTACRCTPTPSTSCAAAG